MALDAIETMSSPPQYRAVRVDDAQDCTPVMMRLARRLLAESNGPLTVFADPAQAIYEHGFQWTQHELRPAGGNVRWLRKNYRCTREVYDLARPLLEDHAELAEDPAQMQEPERHGRQPVLIVDDNQDDLLTDVAGRVSTAARERPPGQIGVLAPKRALKALADGLAAHRLSTQLVERGVIRLEEPSVKLLKQQSAKGLDFPFVFALPAVPNRQLLNHDLLTAEARRTLYVALTRCSEQLVVASTYEPHHPLLDELASDFYTLQGTRAREFVGTRGARHENGDMGTSPARKYDGPTPDATRSIRNAALVLVWW
jgi:superfamily I DNA/RNA helicase